MSSVPPSFNVSVYAGTPFVSIILNWGLFGVLSIQTYLYIQAFPNDRVPIKLVVSGVYLLIMAQTILLTETAWNMLVKGFGSFDALNNLGTTWMSVCVIGGLMALISQWFYAYRLMVLSQRRIIPGFIILISLISLYGALATAVNDFRLNRSTALAMEPNESSTFVEIGIWVGTSAACDVVVALSMCYYLQFHKRNQYGRFLQTKALVSKIVRTTIETGVLTASISLLTLILYYPTTLRKFTYYQIPVSVHAKIYSTTMLAVLNSRVKFAQVSEAATWRDTELAVNVTPYSFSRDTHAIELQNTIMSGGTVRPTNVFVTREKIVSTDVPKIAYPDSRQFQTVDVFGASESIGQGA